MRTSSLKEKFQCAEVSQLKFYEHVCLFWQVPPLLLTARLLPGGMLNKYICELRARMEHTPSDRLKVTVLAYDLSCGNHYTCM